MDNYLKSFFKDNKVELEYVLLLVVLLLIICIPKLLIQYHVGVANWDTYLYLENGRNFAKMGWGDVSSIAPLLPMILSKQFLLVDHTFVSAIFNTDVIAYIVGSVSFYLLLRFKFSRNVSLTGSMIYSTFTLLYSWVAIGGNDIIGTTGTILTLYFVLLAHTRNTKIYYLAVPIAFYAFLSRYTAGIMIFSLLLYIIISRINLKEFRDIVIGFVIGIVCSLYFLMQFYKTLGTPFPFLGQFSGTVSNTEVLDAGFLPDVWYYITHIPNYLSSTIPPGTTFNAVVNPMGNIPTILSHIYILLAIIGCILLFTRFARVVRDSDIKFLTRKRVVLLVISILLTVLAIATLNSVSYILTDLLVLLILAGLWLILEEYNIKNMNYDILMISLFVFYITFMSILSTKNDRYFIAVLPFIAFFITNTISRIYEYINNNNIKIINRISTPTIITIVVVVCLVVGSLAFCTTIPEENDYGDIPIACSWLEEHDTINNQTVIYSDNWPAVTWYLNIYTQRGILDNNDSASILEFSHDMLSENITHHAASYYINTRNEDVEYPGLTLINTVGNVRIYENTYLVEHPNASLKTDEYSSYINSTLEDYNKTMVNRNV